ncbi:hypothetical protein K6119_11265 [Paracrocinitomix mangrovi]|uniref:hypothetical protein n=1 Tax=Paracrocinitomix mangrovi TaxID=2862509 RepID=UPI001C8EE993|nr:hypothetical protein [Paracrocinitomix mangrovi]UKN00313.1 hypothetical protein K6119_11265 [Paracrocinitomix mangrovi]
MDSLDEVRAEKRIEIFEELVSPVMSSIGLNNWNGKYLWFSDFNSEGIKFVVEYQVFKGFGGSFAFGICYENVPTVSNWKKLVNHKTDKSTKIHYYKRLEGWQASYDGTDRTSGRDIVSHWNEVDFRKTLFTILESLPSRLEPWFKARSNRDQNILELQNEIKGNTEFVRRIVNPDYILCFLNAEKGDLEKSKVHFSKYFDEKLAISKEFEPMQELISKRIEKLTLTQ